MSAIHPFVNEVLLFNWCPIHASYVSCRIGQLHILYIYVHDTQCLTCVQMLYFI